MDKPLFTDPMEKLSDVRTLLLLLSSSRDDTAGSGDRPDLSRREDSVRSEANEATRAASCSRKNVDANAAIRILIIFVDSASIQRAIFVNGLGRQGYCVQ